MATQFNWSQYAPPNPVTQQPDGSVYQKYQQYLPGFQNQNQTAPPAPPGPPGQPAPNITQGPIWTPQQIQAQQNAAKSNLQSGAASDMRRMNQQAAARGMGAANSNNLAAQQQAMLARTNANYASQAQAIDYQAASGNAQHTLNTQKAASDNYYKTLADEIERAKLGQSGWWLGQQNNYQGMQLAATMANAEQQRLQDFALAQLKGGYDIFGQGYAQEHALGMQQGAQQWQSGENVADRAFQDAMQKALFGQQTSLQQGQQGWQSGENVLARDFDKAMQDSLFGQQRFMQGEDIASKYGLQSAEHSQEQTMFGLQEALSKYLQGSAQTHESSEAALQRELSKFLQGSQQSWQTGENTANRQQELEVQARDIQRQYELQGKQISHEDAMQLAQFQQQSAMQTSEQGFQKSMQDLLFGQQKDMFGLTSQFEAGQQTQRLTSAEQQQLTELQARRDMQTEQLTESEQAQLRDLESRASMQQAGFQQERTMFGDQSAFQKSMQDALFGQQSSMLGQQTAATKELEQMRLGSAEAMQTGQQQWQSGESAAAREFQGTQSAADRQQQAMLETQRIGAQMEQLQAQLQSTNLNAEQEREVRWKMAELQNTMNLAIQGLQGTQQYSLEQLKGTQSLDQIRQQYAGQTSLQEAKAAQDQAMAETMFWNNLASQDNQYGWQDVLAENQFERQAPLMWNEQNIRAMPYSPQVMATQQYYNTLGNVMSSAAQGLYSNPVAWPLAPEMLQQQWAAMPPYPPAYSPFQFGPQMYQQQPPQPQWMPGMW